MRYKTLYKNKGFTLVELIIVVTIITIVTSTVVLNTNPGESKKKARDNTRLSDVANLERAINDYFLDNLTYPGEVNVTYKSTDIPNLSNYINPLPSDYDYYYITDGNTYEINTVLEHFTDLMEKDNGDNINVYEVGNNLELISTPPQVSPFL